MCRVTITNFWLRVSHSQGHIWFDSHRIEVTSERDNEDFSLYRKHDKDEINLKAFQDTSAHSKKKPYPITDNPSATILPSLWLRCPKKQREVLFVKPRHDTQRCPAPTAAWAEADRQLMSLDEGSLQTASWISHHLPLTCTLIQSEPASAASRGPEGLCKLRDSRLMQRTS